MGTETKIGVLLGILALIITAWVAVRLWRRRRTRDRRVHLDRELQWYAARHDLELAQQRNARTDARRLDTVVEEKRTRFLNVPNVAFHFVDEQQVRAFYDDYFKEPTIASLVSELSDEITAQLKGGLPQVLESQVGAKDLSKWISTIKLPDTSLNGMFVRYQRETIRSGQVVIGLEEVDIELTDLQAFDDLIERLRIGFEMTLDDEMLAKHRSRLRERAAERTLAKLEQATGWVLIEGRFTIVPNGDYYRCVYRHPVTDYVPSLPEPVVISIALSTSEIKDRVAGNYASSVGRAIPLRVYGQIWQPIDRRAGIYDLHLTPLAVY